MQTTAPISLEQTNRVTGRVRFFPVWLVALVILVALAGIGVLALMHGITRIPPADVLTIIFTEGGERVPRIVIWDVRLPRYLLGTLAGGSLAVAGTMLQDSLKNELAEPGLLGVASGASLVVAFIAIFDIVVPFGTLPLFALAGGLIAGVAILFVTRLTKDPVRMILIGAAIGAFFSALITVIVVLGDPNEIRALYTYLVGSLIGRDWDHVRLVLPWIAVALPIALLLGRQLNLLQLGDDMAEGLGLSVFRTRAVVLLVAIVLQAAVVAVGGPIGFLALIAPHMARGLLRTTDARQVLPISALIGALLLASADLVAREIFRPAELPVGLVTTAIGAPFALVLLRRLMSPS